jgi:hypothetical protein
MKLVNHKCVNCGEVFPLPEGEDGRCSVCGRLLCEECYLGRSGILDEKHIDVCGNCLDKKPLH